MNIYIYIYYILYFIFYIFLIKQKKTLLIILLKKKLNLFIFFLFNEIIFELKTGSLTTITHTFFPILTVKKTNKKREKVWSESSSQSTARIS